MSFLVSELIRKKRDGGELNSRELHFLVDGFSTGSIPDYQISAWLMAAYLRGLSSEETFDLTCEMKNSGQSLNWRSLSANFQTAHFADKHSTGGVGDKVSLILAPVAACLGLKVPMMSGRGLGHTGGTVDKLQSIPGFNMYPDLKQMIQLLDEVGVCMMAQAANLCPADRKLYSLRDVTSTVENISLITASILSKKWAEGIDTIVFDVKTGDAAFMQKREDAHALALSLNATAQRAGLKAMSVISRMDEPLGAYIGNACEVKESLQILAQQFSSPLHQRLAEPLKQLSLELAADMAVLAGTHGTFSTALAAAHRALDSGEALKVFHKMAALQGAEPDWLHKLAVAPHRLALRSPRSGFIRNIRSRALGMAGLKIGIGRRHAEDAVDPAVAFEMAIAVGDEVQKDQALLWMHLQRPEQAGEISAELLAAFDFADQPVAAANLILERLS